MTAKGITPYVVAALVLIGSVCVALRYHARRDARMGLADTAWRLTSLPFRRIQALIN